MNKENEEKLKIEIINLLNDAEIIYLKKKENISFNSDKEKNNKLKSLYSLKKSRDILISEIKEYKDLIEEISEDSEKEILKRELDLLIISEKELIEKSKDIIIEEEGVRNNCLVEIRPGAGGIEAGLFVRDLYQMYYRFSDRKGWKLEIVESRSDSLGNFSFISFLVKGDKAFQWLRNESGVHRVQRIPITESKGRLQTSTVSVVVLPEINDVAVKIETKDLRIDTYRSGGAGGQHVNTTDSAIRITHIPTGIVATSQDGRSQHDNKDKALFILKSRLFEKYKNDQENELGNIRSSAIGNSERAEKIRTYNYPQNRLTDHRINLNLNKLNTIIDGDLEELCKNLMIFEIEKRLSNFIKKISVQKN
ncbi:MAG: Peptide chain release factor 1 [Mycoplasmataceae bacterium]|nr:MAG: Peptide chain release factor 1 [Mycoplasmataceae bacterium]